MTPLHATLQMGRSPVIVRLTVESYHAPEATPRQSASSRLKDYFIGAIPLQKRLESVRKQTSFKPTPPRKKIPQCSQLPEDVDPQKFSFLLHKQRTLYSLTPLYKFSYTNFKQYSKLLNAFIAAEKQKGLAVEVGEDFNIKVIFSTLLGMKGTERPHTDGKIKILCHKYLIGMLAYLTELAIFQID
ncbi:centromere protein L-like [Hippopotamus amphibius kiboko]|uniref:centromere protein L-like n=1 Tax=Hippopotamus amphibius kiboko TaxID=575201 RepID=UPI0025945634|nr:centromere protein L-like [Hippopotamus amphibius kiboko]